MDWTQQAKQLFNVLKPEHFTNYRHWCECAEQSHHAPSLEEVHQALPKIQGSMAAIVIAERDEH